MNEMSEAIRAAAEEMKRAAVKKAEVMCLGLHIDSARRIISALRALPLPEEKPDPRDAALVKAWEALREIVDPTPTTKIVSFRHFAQNIAAKALAALDAAKGAG